MSAALFQRALEIVPEDPLVWGTYLFSLNLRDDVDAATVAREHFRFGELLEGKSPPTPLPARPRNGRIRVGYVSGDLLSHPVAWFLIPVLVHHDRERFDKWMTQIKFYLRNLQMNDVWVFPFWVNGGTDHIYHRCQPEFKKAHHLRFSDAECEQTHQRLLRFARKEGMLAA
jgi:predicted O-linked N-acetylglucosamine transferase (SPINDLY family)